MVQVGGRKVWTDPAPRGQGKWGAITCRSNPRVSIVRNARNGISWFGTPLVGKKISRSTGNGVAFIRSTSEKRRKRGVMRQNFRSENAPKREHGEWECAIRVVIFIYSPIVGMTL